MHGQCLCGAVQFKLSTRPKLLQCHCSLCRKQGGSVSNTATIIPAGHFRWIQGQEQIGSWVKETGFRSDFCRTCGAVVPNPMRDTPYVWVPSGLLDGREPLEIAVHIHVASKAVWDTLPAAGQRFETTPGLEALVALLAEK